MPKSSSNSPKFTRGEKCIFTHVVITFAGILAVVVVYFGHVCLVRHRGNRAVALGRAGGEPGKPETAYRCVGAVYVRVDGAGEGVRVDGAGEGVRVDGAGGGVRKACGTAALSDRWSLAPARCVAARASPHLSHLLPHWTLRYDFHHTGVRRGAVHPHYEGDGAADVGLFEHEQALPVAEHDEPLVCAVPSATRREELESESALFLVGWLAEGERAVAAVRLLGAARCKQLLEPVDPAANSSLCLTPRPDRPHDRLPSPLLGAVVFEGSQLVGICSWDTGTDNSVPIKVAVNIAAFKHWLETTMKVL